MMTSADPTTENPVAIPQWQAPLTGSPPTVVFLGMIKEPKGVPKAKDMIRQLVEGHEAVVRTARSLFPVVEKGGDEATADLLTQRIQLHEKTAWMLRSLLAD